MDSSKIPFNGKSIAKNTFYNLLGYCIPLVVAIGIIPFLIKGLGTERFGILNLVWVVIGYFSFFDFGIGRALTKIIAEKIGINETDEVPGIFWTSFYLMLIISFIGSLILFFTIPSLVHNVLNISKDLQDETQKTFYVLVISIPIVTTTTGTRGVLEAYQKFGIINVIRVFLGIAMFVIPLACLVFTKSLFWIVIFLTIVRAVVWALYFAQCFKIKIHNIGNMSFNTKLVIPILKMSGWMTVSNIIVPLIVYMDRFMIGALVSATAIAYYATPYEAITKLLLIPGALIGVLFPAFSASYISNPEFAKKLTVKAVKYCFIFLFPIVIIIIAFAHEGMSLWLGGKFAENSSLILQLLTVGVLFNGIAYIPFTYLQGIGKPEITAIVNLIEMPFYFVAMWLAIKFHGVNGAAFVWLLRMLVDSIILFIFAQKEMSGSLRFEFKSKYIYFILLIGISLLPIFIINITPRIIIALVLILNFIFVSWKFILKDDERKSLFLKITRFNF